MTPEQEDAIEAMTMAAYEDGLPNVKNRHIEAALRAAREHGYVMAKIPDHKQQPTAQGWDHISGWNMAVDAIETIEIEE